MTTTRLLSTALAAFAAAVPGVAQTGDVLPVPVVPVAPAPRPAAEEAPKAAAAEPPAKPTVVKIEGAELPPQGMPAFAKMLGEAKAAYAKTRDYAGHLVRQERVGGTLLPEQTAEVRVRTEPFAIDVKVVLPKAANGWETTYVSGRKTEYVRHRASAVAAVQTLKADDPKAAGGLRHTVQDTGLAAILARAEKMVETEKKVRNPVQVLVAEYQFEGRPCRRFEIFCERPHAARYAHRAVLYVDAETKLPVRWEAYDAPKPGEPAGDLLEAASFVNLRFNLGLTDAAFDK